MHLLESPYRSRSYETWEAGRDAELPSDRPDKRNKKKCQNYRNIRGYLPGRRERYIGSKGEVLIDVRSRVRWHRHKKEIADRKSRNGIGHVTPVCNEIPVFIIWKDDKPSATCFVADHHKLNGKLGPHYGTSYSPPGFTLKLVALSILTSIGVNPAQV
ncbi:uncharacterized protein BO97DRAFT_418690 [Aspergillus homomorphus CBS 101889]|uniref:Uncharacterized protein n=1 Tax=Aspergillus homomorphus (strain CBS 101889) TaxID=1450537 RepID=A0A395HHE4_ASPHC|nr:hypothetical protein BO97DRAFT_418690 [Aspergillus homomorphus CBS 101889]RAL07311.1 hypothetical protein BO97DRAFT_418690 [Aspergillus homomorphus CBS 101889]